MIIRVGKRKLCVTTDEVGIHLRWEPPPRRDPRVIDGELVTRRRSDGG